MTKHHPYRRLPGAALIVLASSIAAPACLSRPIERIDPGHSVTRTEDYTQSRVDKIDLLLAIDDSGSMLDKQKILAVAVPELVDGLINPPCLDPDGNLVEQPPGPLDECPVGSRREFEPVLDIHIGIISSSLGPRGSEWIGTEHCHDDGGKLLNRGGAAGPVPTFEDKGFLVWQPEAAEVEPGLYNDREALKADLQTLVTGVEQNGCGHEAQLESWYRFLVDPAPYAEINMEGGRAVPSGVDEDLLQQRREFLRPDSLVAIIMLSDENDCSFRAEGYGYYTTSGRLGEGILSLKPRSECALNPNDPCCAPCGHEPETCPKDDTCDDPALGDEQKLTNLTCFDQKRRYGVDFLYPTSRYVEGLTQTEILDAQGEVHKNPLLVSEDGLQRGKDRVFLAGIVGVPWQLIARDPADLEKGLLDANERVTRGTWDAILGDPVANVPPADPHMRESIHPREDLPGPDAAADADPLNGHEWDVSVPGTGDLQYACTFELPEPITCDADFENCDCDPGHGSNNPLCQADDGSYGNTQYRAKAYPGRRELAVLEGIGNQGIVGSICPDQLDDSVAKNYGYKPAVGAIIERLKQELSAPCLPRSLTPDSHRQVSCIILEGRALPDDESCSCNLPGRRDVLPEHRPAVEEALSEPTAQGIGLDCFCEIEQLDGEALEVCQTSIDEEPALDGQRLDGWCYIDAMSQRPVGNPQLAAHCQENERRVLRFVGAGEPVEDSYVSITCAE